MVVQPGHRRATRVRGPAVPLQLERRSSGGLDPELVLAGRDDGRQCDLDADGRAQCGHRVLELALARCVADSSGVVRRPLCPQPVRHVSQHRASSLVTYLVPPVCALSLHLATADAQGLRWSRCWGVMAGAILLGINDVYYAFFGSFVLLVSILIGWGRHAASLSSARAPPSCWSSSAAPRSTSCRVSTRIRRLGVPITVDVERPAESERYGLKIRHLVSPCSSTHSRSYKGGTARGGYAVPTGQRELFRPARDGRGSGLPEARSAS